MRSKLFGLISLVMILSMVLAACQTPTPEKVVETVVVKEQGETKIVTATPVPTQAVSFKSKDPTVFNMVISGEPETLDPALDYESAGGEILWYVYDTLITLNKDKPNEYVSNLATEVPTLDNGGISKDGLTYTFKIRTGVKFHDGSDMTMDDIYYTFVRNLLYGSLSSPQWLFTEALFGAGVDDVAVLIDPNNPPYDDREAVAKVDPAKLKGVCETVEKAISVDAAANTVTFHLTQPWGPFLPAFTGSWGSIMSKKYSTANGGWDGDCATWQNFYAITSEDSIKTGIGSKPMGTGPYIFDHWTPKEELVLKANANYWRKDPMWTGGPSGVPAIKTINIKYVDEFSTRLAMLKAGDADYIQYGPDNWPVLDDLVGETCQYGGACTPSKDPTQPLRLIKGQIGGTRTDFFFTFTINPEGNNFIGSGKLDGNGIPANFFSDIHVRRAIEYCFDYNTYLNDVLQGDGVRSKTVMLPGMIGYDENAPFYDMDLKKCEEEFKASKWNEVTDASGKVTYEPDPNGKISLWDTGFRFTSVYNTGNTTRQVLSQILQNQLAAMNPNFVVEVTGIPWATFLRTQRAKQLPLFTVGWIMDLYDTHNWVVPYTTGTYGNRQNLPADLQAKFREIYSRAVVEVDPAKRAEIYKEFNQLFYDSATGILLFQVKPHEYQPRYIDYASWYYNPILTTSNNTSIYAETKK